MKRHNLIAVLLVICCGNLCAQSEFRFRRKITGVETEAWYSLALSADMFQHLKRDLADMRVYRLEDRDTVEVPYLLKILEDEVQRENVNLELFNKSTRDGIMYLTFEMDPSRKVNFIELKFDEANYLGHVTVEGSDDRLRWFEVLKDHRIVSIDREEEDFEFSTIQFPLSSYRYLRLGVTSDVDLHFRSASFGYNRIKPGTYHDVPLTWNVKTDRKSRQSIIDIRLQHYVPVSTISVQVSNDNDFYRGFKLMYVRDSVRSDKGWIKNYQGILDGHLTSYQTTRFEFPPTLTSDLRIIVRDYDNSPLKIGRISAEGPEVNVVAYLKPGNNFLLYDAAKVGKPVYDLTHFENQIPGSPETADLAQSVEIPVATSGDDPLFQDKAWLWSIMGVMIVGLGFFTIKMMKQ